MWFRHDVILVLPILQRAAIVPDLDSVTAQSFWSSLEENTPHRDNLYCGYRQGIRSVTRDDGWKLICSQGVDGIQREQLFFIPEDPYEMDNLASTCDHLDTLIELKKLLEQGHSDSEDMWSPLSKWQGVPA